MFDKAFFTKKQEDLIKKAIRKAELNTTGEIRVHLSKTCSESILDCAAHWFGKLKMHKKKQRNGVLFYLSTKDKKFAIIGDVGINSKVPNDFWDKIKETMLDSFKAGEFAEGLSQGVLMAGQHLKQHFPNQNKDINELSDDISVE